MESELHNETPKTPNKTRKTPKNIHKTLTNWRNKQNLTSIFVIWVWFGNKGGVNDMNWFKVELDFDFKPHGRTCFSILNGFRFWIGFGTISVSDDHVFVFGMKMKNLKKYAEPEERSNKMKRWWIKNDFILNKIIFLRDFK